MNSLNSLMDNRLFIKKCYFCGEASTEENPLYYYDFGDNTTTKIELCHKECWEKKERKESNA